MMTETEEDQVEHIEGLEENPSQNIYHIIREEGLQMIQMRDVGGSEEVETEPVTKRIKGAA